MPFEIEQVRSVLARSAPETLYHYTTQDGLLGIVRSGELWATNVQYMNDRREFFLALEIAAERLKGRARFDPDPSVNRLSANLIKRLENIEDAPVCAVSFCVNPDLLSQWRGYAGSSGGICLGFRSEALAMTAASMSGMLAACIYGKAEQEKIIDEMIGLAIEDVRQLQNHNDVRITAVATNFLQQLIRCGALFKDEGFHEEAEWRLVSGVRENLAEYEYKVGNSMLMPYLKFGLRIEHWANEIQSATVGPCPHPDDVVRAVRGLFAKHGISGNVSSSNVPYRNW
jgi:Protein of unknown function (DUF2971)